MATLEPGVVVSIGAELYFVRETLVRQILEERPVTRVPGTALGMTLVDGRVVPVVEITPARGPLLLCEDAGELVLLSGLTVVSVGMYATDGERILIDDCAVSELSIADYVRSASVARQQPPSA